MDIIVVGLWVATALSVVIALFFAAMSIDRQANRNPAPWVAGYVVFLLAALVLGGHALYGTFNDTSVYGVFNREGLHQALWWVTVSSGLVASGLMGVLFAYRRSDANAARLGLLMSVFAFAVAALSAFAWDGLL